MAARGRGGAEAAAPNRSNGGGRGQSAVAGAGRAVVAAVAAPGTGRAGLPGPCGGAAGGGLWQPRTRRWLHPPGPCGLGAFFCRCPSCCRGSAAGGLTGGCVPCDAEGRELRREQSSAAEESNGSAGHPRGKQGPVDGDKGRSVQVWGTDCVWSLVCVLSSNLSIHGSLFVRVSDCVQRYKPRCRARDRRTAAPRCRAVLRQQLLLAAPLPANP